MPKQVDRDERERVILEAAARVFARQGFEAAKMSDVAAEAGLGKATLYDSFPDKQSLFFKVLEQTVQAHLHAVHSELANGPVDAASRLSGLIRGAVADLERHPEQVPLWLQLWAASVRPELSSAFKAQHRLLFQGFRIRLADIVREGIRRGELRTSLEPEGVAAGIVASLEGMLLQRWFDPSLELGRVAEAFADALVEGLKPRSR